MNKKLPLFAKRLLTNSQQSLAVTNEIFIFLGDAAWGRAENRIEAKRFATLLPVYDMFPENYKWDFVRGYAVLIIETSSVDYQIIRKLSFELLKAKAGIVRALIINGTKPQLIVFPGGAHEYK